MKQPHTRLVAWAMVMLPGLSLLWAGTSYWDGGPGGTGTSWSVPANWSGDILPGIGDTAEFSYSAGATTKAYTMDAPQAIGTLSFQTYGNQPVITIGNGADVAAGNTLTLSGVFRGDNVGNMQTIAANVALATNSTWEIRPGYNNGVTVSGSISGSGKALAKWGTGTLTLQGTNLYTGDTAINTGTLQLDFNTAAGPLTNLIDASSPLKMKGGTLNLNGRNSSGAKRSQTFDSLTVTAGASGFTIVNNNAAAYTRLTLGTITHNSGGTLNLTQPTVNTTLGADNGYTTTNSNDASGILGAYVTVAAADWAANNGVNIAAYTGYTTLSGDAPNIADSATGNIRISNSSTGNVGLASATVTVNSLLAKDSVPRTVTIGSGNTLRLGAVGGLLTPVGTGPLTINGGTLTAGGADNATGEIIFQNATAVTNTAVIADNGSGPVALTKAGAGNLALTVASTHTGGTYMNAGTLFLPGGVNPLYTNGLFMMSGGTLNLGGCLQTNASTVIFRGGTTTNGTIVKSGVSYDAQGGTVAAILGGSAGLVKTTPGVLSLSGANTYTGDTAVREGYATFTGNAIVKGNLIVGSPDGGLPASAAAVNTPFTASKNFTVYGNGSLSFGTSAQYLSATLTIMGGSFTGSQPYFQTGTVVYMTGGTLGGTIYGNGNFGITSYSNSKPAVVAANLSNSHTFSVEDGASVFDLIYSGGHGGASKTLTKSGAGVMSMTGSGRSYSGSTVVNGGTLLVNNTTNSCTGNSAVSVATGATLGGVGFIGGVAGYGSANVTLTGSVAGSTTNRAAVVPGTLDPVTGAHVIGTLTVGNLAAQTNNVTFGAYSALKVNIATNGTCDNLAVNGTLSLATASDKLEVTVADAAALNPGTYTLVTFQQLAAAGQTFDTASLTDIQTGLPPTRGSLVYTATSIDYVINSAGTLISVK